MKSEDKPLDAIKSVYLHPCEAGFHPPVVVVINTSSKDVTGFGLLACSKIGSVYCGELEKSGSVIVCAFDAAVLDAERSE